METFTYKEIMQQPAMWLQEYEQLKHDKAAIVAFLNRYLTSETEVVLTGAGTSAFIGDSLAPVLRQGRMKNCRAVATTDLVTHTAAYLDQNTPLLLISFARSGNSPESVATVNKVNAYCKHVAHIFITCNENGELAKMAGKENILSVLLPKETNDKSLAMTSSFSTMWIACVMLSHIDEIERQEAMVRATAENAQYILDNCQDAIREIAGRGFERGIFLGSGPMKGIAEECHLKLQELTDGAVVCKFDSFLGFRHGPKAVVNSKSVVIYLTTDDEDVQRYERDLIRQVDGNNKLVAQIAVCQGKKAETGVNYDLTIVMPNGKAQTGLYGYLPYVLVGQLLGINTSISHGLNPDTPSVSGNISRVVEGVTIY
ncbi:MAG: SIS domain-containing protein [Paludibacteraceae bacterium]|nr:SIS domain-containing protein [Paludibacteraceae bacterium]